MPNVLDRSVLRVRDALLRFQPLTILVGSLVIGLLMSTQYLFQLFIWRHWPIDEVLAGWLEVARDRAIVFFAIGLALIAAIRVPTKAPRSRSVMIGAGILVGTAAGELALLAIGSAGAPTDLAALIGRISRWSIVAGTVAATSYMWLRARDASATVQANELRRAQLERQTEATRLAILRVQIEPHFLFNTLATVRRLHQTQPADGARLLGHFVEYLRSTQAGVPEEHVTLAQEIGLARAYLGVIMARMSGRLQATFDVADDLWQAPFPPLAIATLVENAVKHGIAPLPQGGTISISVKAVNGTLEAAVTDTGAGFVGSSGTGIGLANIRARLQTLYGSAGTLTLGSNAPRGVRATIRIPLDTARIGA